MRRFAPWILTLALTAGLTATTVADALRRYDALDSGWSWDLAYYNQWFWALTRGDGRITVRPLGPWTQEGPSVWTTNYLAPVRLAIAPLYRLAPDPRTLLVVQGVLLWLVVPAAYTLVRSESGSGAVALSAAVLVPLTPLLWPLARNDFRELQLALPFVLWAVQGVRSRNVRLTALGVAGVLACREEYAVLVASLSVLPPRDPEDIGRRYRWARALSLVGVGWFLFGFLGYSRWLVTSYAWDIALGFLDESTALGTRLRTASRFVSVGLGSWAVLACLSPRAALLVVPWVWKLAGGLFALRFLGSGQWHHVRYTAPLVAVSLAAGCVGYAGLARSWLHTPRGAARLAGVWLLAVAGLAAADVRLARIMAGIPRRVAPEQVAPLREWFGRIGPDEGVIAHYDVTAPLSSRASLYSYVMMQNVPIGYPLELPPEITWLFYRNADPVPVTLTRMGFRPVYEGPEFRILRRERPQPDAASAGGYPRGQENSGPPPRFRGDFFDLIGYVVGNGVILGLQAFWTLLLLVPAVVLSRTASRRAAALTTGAASADVCGEDAAARMLAAAGVHGVSVAVDPGPMTDHFDRPARTVRLSATVARGRGLGELAAAAREAAHAELASSMGLKYRWLLALRDAAGMAVGVALSLGWMFLAAGCFLALPQPFRVGAALLSLSAVGTLGVRLVLDRPAVKRAPALLEQAGLIAAHEREQVESALAALAWAPLVPRRLLPFLVRRGPNGPKERNVMAE